MKKGLVFGGLGLLFALSMWFIFAPSGKDKTAAEQGLNDSIPQATTEKLTENKLKAYELGDKAHEEEQTREEMGRLSDYFAENTAPTETKRAEAAVSTAKIEAPCAAMRRIPACLTLFTLPIHTKRNVRHYARRLTISKRNYPPRAAGRTMKRNGSSH